MKNNNPNITRQEKAARQFALHTDILVRADVVEGNRQKLQKKTRRKRRIDYAKKIMNDPLILNA
jgi:hypothetical protein